MDRLKGEDAGSRKDPLRKRSFRPNNRLASILQNWEDQNSTSVFSKMVNQILIKALAPKYEPIRRATNR